MPEKEPPKFELRPFVIEMIVYSILVFAYFFLVLHFLDHWLKGLFDQHRTAYAVVGLAMMITQAVGLEAITTGLLRLFGSGRTE